MSYSQLSIDTFCLFSNVMKCKDKQLYHMKCDIHYAKNEVIKCITFSDYDYQRNNQNCIMIGKTCDNNRLLHQTLIIYYKGEQNTYSHLFTLQTNTGQRLLYCNKALTNITFNL